MGKDKSRLKMRKGKQKKAFLDNQKKHRREVKLKKKTGITEKDAYDKRAFTFQNFSDQVASVDSSIVYQLAGVGGKVQISSDSGLTSSVFTETLAHWKDLNLTSRFQATQKKLVQYSSLHQVVFSQTDIVQVLCEHLAQATVLDIQPVLELTAALATDLQQEFYPHLNQVIDILMSHPLRVRDASMIKWSLRCLAHLLKILWRPVSMNLKQVYDQLKGLFDLKRPDFIRHLGAETVAFLLRKSKEKETFLLQILTFGSETDPKAIAKLLFEGIKTVNEQFNTHLQTLWPLYLNHLTENHVESGILETIFHFCADHSCKEFLLPLLDQTFEKINVFTEENKTLSADYLMKCLAVIVRISGGKAIKDVEKFWTLFDSHKIASDQLLDLIMVFLKADKMSLTGDLADKVVKLVMNSEHFPLDMKLKFVTQFIDHPLFDVSLVKPYMVLVQDTMQSECSREEMMGHLADVVKTSYPPCKLGTELVVWRPNLIDLQLVRELRSLPPAELFTRSIIEDISITNRSETISDALTCISAIKPTNKKVVLPKISELVKDLTRKEYDNKVSLLPQAISTLVHLVRPESIEDLVNIEDIVEVFLVHDPPTLKVRLQSLNFTLSALSSMDFDPGLGLDSIRELLKLLLPCIGSPDEVTRELSLHTMTLLIPGLGKQVHKVFEEGQLSLMGLVETLLSAERCPLSLASYKDKLNQLERVDYGRVSRVLKEFPDLALVPLHYLLGLLYTNFTLLWGPLMDLVANYAHGFNKEVFWGVFSDKLKTADKDISKMIKGIEDGEDIKTDLRIDYINYRNHLWTVMTKFPQVAEAKNREIVPLFLDNFMKTEYVSIRRLSENRKEAAESHKSVVQSTVKSLLTQLGLLAKFLDLKSLHRGEEVRELVVGLLCHKLASVQKVALEILVAYKLKFLLPYKDNLFRLLEEKDFKAELINFPLAGDDTEIKQEHRADIIPIIMKLLYGRLRAKKATKKGGKGGISARRGLILHHLMEVSEEEKIMFFDLVFKDLFTGCSLEAGQDVFNYILEVGEAPVKSTKQMQACVEMFQVILSKLGKLLNTSLSYLLTVIVWLGFTTQKMIEKENSSPLKSLRNNICSQMANFYSKYTNYAFTASQDDSIFKVFLWNTLKNFDTDFIHSSSGVLQLLLSWSKTREHRRLFLLTHPETGYRVLENVCRVLVKPKINQKVIDTVLDIVHNLVSVVDESDMEVEDQTNDGVIIVLKELDTILQHFQIWIKATNDNQKNMRKVGLKLEILASLAPHVVEPTTALDLFQQLVTLSNSLKKADTVLKVLTISKLLMVHISQDKVEQVVNTLVPLFGKLSTRDERLELSMVLENAAKTETSLALVAEVCVELNSFDRRRVEEPDFERRITMFKKIRDIVKEKKEMSILEINSIVFNCCFYLKNETDSSLKSSALEALVNVSLVMKNMAESSPESTRLLIEKVCLVQIRTGIKNKDDTVRCDFVSFLQALVKNCAEVNGRLRDLARLSDEDSDNDFFENMRHVQLHRRGRAMARLAKSLDEDSTFVKQKNLSQIILPLATVYLLTDSYAKNSDLVEQAIMLVGSVTKTLPWGQYENSIKYYLELFTKNTSHQKQLVKITTAILDAFHFEVNSEKGAKNDKTEEPQIEDISEEKTERADDTNETVDKEVTDKEVIDKAAADKDAALKSKIYFTVNDVLLPKLQATLSGKVKGPTAISDEDKLILRVPLAIPIIKMLKIMSFKSLYRAVPGIVNKIASFLKSKAIEIREAARTTLVEVMFLLGPRYVAFVIKELQAQLTKGYQLHILSFTLHTMLHKMGEQGLLEPGDLDSACGQVMDVCLGEMFGIVSEEKDVRQITGKLMEARGTKAYDTLQVLSKYVSNQQLMALAKPIADKCAQLSTFKNLVKIRESFRNIVLGLLANTGLDPLHCLIFIYGVTTDQIKLGANSLTQRNSMKKEGQQSIFIVPPAPKRAGVQAKTSKSASQHIIHEFGLSLLNFLLKRSSLLPDDTSHCQRLEPFVQILLDFLSSSHVTVTTASLRSLLWLVKFPLACLDREKILEITNKVFELLNKFGGGTDCKGENNDLVIIASKLLVVLIRDVELTQLNETHLKTVLDYVANDVLDPFKVTTAFGLLTAIVGRKLASPELHDVILKIMELSIQSPSGQTRTAARSVIMAYVTNYNLKKKLAKVLDFFSNQLSYELESGRLSAAETLRSLISCLGTQKVEPHATFLFFSLAPQLVNDESSACRKLVATSLGTLLKTVSPGTVDKLLGSVVTWYQEDNLGHNQLACHLLCVFADHLQVKVFRSHLQTILARLPAHVEGTSDHLAVQALNLVTRLVRKGEAEEKVILDVNEGRMLRVWQSVHTALLHSHAWVRLLSSLLVGMFLGQVSQDKMFINISTGEGGGWLADIETLRTLILDCLEQLSLHNEPESELGTQVIKNLVALTKVTLLPGWKELIEKKKEFVSFHWIVKKAVKVANQELISSPKIVFKRTLVFNLIAASCLDTAEDNIVNVLGLVLPPLHREISSNQPHPELKAHCQEVVDLIKSKVEEETFTSTYMEIQMNMAKKKGERVAKQKQNLVLNPEVAAKRKIKQHENRKKAKKAKYSK